MGVVKKIGQKIGLIGQDYQSPEQQRYGEFSGAVGQARAAQEEQNIKQTELANILAAKARGEGPSVAQQQMAKGLSTAQEQAAGQMASQKGLNPALAARMVGNNQARMAGDVAGQSAMMRSQEILDAQNQYANALSNQRAQNQNMYTSSANAMIGQNTGAMQNAMNQSTISAQQGAGLGQIFSSAGQAMASGGSKKTTQEAWTGGEIEDHTQGGHVHGEEMVDGDSPKNDNVLAKLSPGEIVIPKSAAQDIDKAKAFLEHVMKQSKENSPDSGYGKVLAKNRELENRLKILEHCFGGKI
jgi:hypothetical protein